MSKFRLTCLTTLFLSALLLGACGQKGPLYLPDEESGKEKEQQQG